MVLLVNGVVLEEAPSSLNSLFQSHPSLKDSANALCSMKSQVIGPAGLLYVSQREYAVTHPHDNKVSIIGTDDVTTNVILIVRHTGSGTVGVSQLDRVYDEGLTTMLQRVTSMAYGYEGIIELHIIGGYADGKNVSSALITSTLSALHKVRTELDLVTCCVGEVCTIHRNGTPWPVIYGAGVNVKTGEIFPAQFTDKGPDMDLRNARTLTGGENVGLLDIYDCAREEMRIGPFTYEPMRAVDIWLQQSDDFLLQSLCSSPAVAPPTFVSRLRASLKRIKEDPYPSVSIFHTNMPRLYRKDDVSGQWLRYNKEEAWTPVTPPATTPSQHLHNFKQEPIASWPSLAVQPQLYY